jgi:hypothetical protein
MFLSSERALKIARDEIRSTQIQQDPMFGPLRHAPLGQPVLVKDIFKNPSYWLVPVMVEDRVAGFVRVLGTGVVAAVGAFYRDPGEIGTCPTIVTGMDAAEASRRAEERIASEAGEVASAPVFVHDGPVGREAWLVEVSRGRKPRRWIFVTPAFIYERPAGELLDETLE